MSKVYHFPKEITTFWETILTLKITNCSIFIILRQNLSTVCPWKPLISFFSVLQQNSMFLLWRATLKSWWRSGHASFFLHWSRIFRRSQLGKKWYYHTVLYIFWIKTWTCFTKHGTVKNIIIDTLFSNFSCMFLNPNNFSDLSLFE